MKILKQARAGLHFSQRMLAKRAGIAYKTLQLLEGGSHDPRLSTLTQIARALGYSAGAVERYLTALSSEPSDSVCSISGNIVEEGEEHWKIGLFNFIDAFRSAGEKVRYIQTPPDPRTPRRITALLASVTDNLCVEAGIPPPSWTEGIGPLPEPWFPAQTENLKAMALIESPAHFRARNIFVLGNFLERR